MGNEAIAEGAIRAGVAVATGYPGTPSSEILETIAKLRPEGVYAEWSVNEKSALEVAAGAAIAGARALVTMKQVGLNVASDPLICLNYIGVKAGMVVVVADDPGPVSSQTEQDTRRFGQFAKLVVFDPSTPEEACAMVADAFACSEKIGRPVILRPTTRVCHSYASVKLPPELRRRATPEGFVKDGGRWVIFPGLANENKTVIEKTLRHLSGELALYSSLTDGGGRAKKGIATGGVSYCYVREALGIIEERGFADAVRCVRLLKIGTVPFAEYLGLDFLNGLDEALVVEELDPVIEDALLRLCGIYGKKVHIRGKSTDDMPLAGENTVEILVKTISNFLGLDSNGGIRDGSSKPAAPARVIAAETPALPVRPPVLCAGCPHRGAFFAIKEAMNGRRAVFSGDIGCYTLGNARPLEMVDTCLCMGAGITMAQGLDRAEPDAAHFAFIGDSTFFHTGVSGLINAVYNGADIIIVILDNGTTAMTGGQPHPGMARTLMGASAKKISIYELVKGIGADDVQRVNPFDLVEAGAAVARAADLKGVRVIIFEGPCVNIVPRGNPLTVSPEKCRGCGLCVSKLGCPALSAETGRKTDKAVKTIIDATLCTGCGICGNVCAFNAIFSAAGNKVM